MTDFGAAPYIAPMPLLKLKEIPPYPFHFRQLSPRDIEAVEIKRRLILALSGGATQEAFWWRWPRV